MTLVIWKGKGKGCVERVRVGDVGDMEGEGEGGCGESESG